MSKTYFFEDLAPGDGHNGASLISRRTQDRGG